MAGEMVADGEGQGFTSHFNRIAWKTPRIPPFFFQWVSSFGGKQPHHRGMTP